MDNLVEEIKEELKKDQLAKFWKDYGNYLIGAAIAILLGGAGYAYWDYSQEQRRLELTLVYEAALKESDPKRKADAFNKLASSNDKGYSIIGAFEEASLSKKPAEEYRKISNNKKFDKIFRELATIKAISHEMVSGADPNTLLDEISAITKTASPWRELAFEIKASLFLMTGKADQGLKIFESLVTSEKSPAGVRQRSQVILDFVKNR